MERSKRAMKSGSAITAFILNKDRVCVHPSGIYARRSTAEMDPQAKPGAPTAAPAAAPLWDILSRAEYS
jgi:hypothetical protein